MTSLVVFFGFYLKCFQRSITKPFHMVYRRRCTVNISKIFPGSSDRNGAAVFSQHAENLVILEEPAHVKILNKECQQFLTFSLLTCIILTIATQTRTRTLPDQFSMVKKKVQLKQFSKLFTV